MNELKCKECGAEFTHGAKECPSCGCPIEEVKVESATPIKAQTAKNFNVMSIISLLLGVVIIIMGITVMNKEVSIDTYSTQNNTTNYDADYCAFGADFYTEIYKTSDIIVDELNDVIDGIDDLKNGVEVISGSMSSIANVIYYPIGMMIVALGLGVIAVSCNHIKKTNA